MFQQIFHFPQQDERNKVQIADLKAELAKREGESFLNNKKTPFHLSVSQSITFCKYIFLICTTKTLHFIKAKIHYLNIPAKSKKVKASE